MYIPLFPTYLSVYVLTKSEFISSCSRPAVGSNIVQITRATFFVNVFFLKWPPVAILVVQKITSCHFRSMPQFLFFRMFFYKMAAGGHFGYPKLAFDGISGRSIRNFVLLKICTKCRRRLCWMSEIHFRSHFWPFQIDTQPFFLNF